MVDLRAVVDIEDVDHAADLIDPVDDAISAAPGAVAARKRPEQWLADPLRIDRQCGIAELQHSRGDSFRKPLGNRPPGSRLEPDLIPMR